jgi:hypothetical protein
LVWKWLNGHHERNDDARSQSALVPPVPDAASPSSLAAIEHVRRQIGTLANVTWIATLAGSAGVNILFTLAAALTIPPWFFAFNEAWRSTRVLTVRTGQHKVTAS